MKTNYVTKFENKYVFNLSLIVWHFFIALSSLAIVVFMAIFLWSILPASHKEAEKQPYPEKKQYPAPIKVSASELTFGEIRQEEDLPVATMVQPDTLNTAGQQPIEDVKGKTEFEALLDSLKTLIPPSKYSWEGSGYYIYFPNGDKRYWDVYRKEQYRQLIVTEPGILDKFDYAFKEGEAKTYSDKKQILRSFIGLVKILPEEKRIFVINSFLGIFTKGIIPLIDYTTTIISKFNSTQQNGIIDRLINRYYNQFNRNFTNLREATDLFLPLLTEINVGQQSNALMQYYRLYDSKNYQRDREIAKIENEYNNVIANIETQFLQDQAAAEASYLEKKQAKHDYRMKALVGIAGGILLIVLIATILAFLSIQRSVRKIEEKMLPQDNS